MLHRPAKVFLGLCERGGSYWFDATGPVAFSDPTHGGPTLFHAFSEYSYAMYFLCKHMCIVTVC